MSVHMARQTLHSTGAAGRTVTMNDRRNDLRRVLQRLRREVGVALGHADL